MNAIKDYLAGRASRREYWTSMVLMILFLVALGMTRHAGLVNLLTFPLWILISTRRLRAIGWSPWLCFGPIGVTFVLGALSGMAKVVVPGLDIYTVTLGVGVASLLAACAFIIYVGARPSLKPAARLDEAPRLAGAFD